MPRPQFSLKTTLFKIDVRDLFKAEGRLVDDVFLDELMAILVGTDMGAQTAQHVVAEVCKTCRGRVVGQDKLLGTLRLILGRIFSGTQL